MTGLLQNIAIHPKPIEQDIPIIQEAYKWWAEKRNRLKMNDYKVSVVTMIEMYLRHKYPKFIQFGKIKIGRNEICPCGSGKKFKKCCLTLFP